MPDPCPACGHSKAQHEDGKCRAEGWRKFGTEPRCRCGQPDPLDVLPDWMPPAMRRQGDLLEQRERDGEKTARRLEAQLPQRVRQKSPGAGDDADRED